MLGRARDEAVLGRAARPLRACCPSAPCALAGQDCQECLQRLTATSCCLLHHCYTGRGASCAAPEVWTLAAVGFLCLREASCVPLPRPPRGLPSTSRHCNNAHTLGSDAAPHRSATANLVHFHRLRKQNRTHHSVYCTARHTATMPEMKRLFFAYGPRLQSTEERGGPICLAGAEKRLPGCFNRVRGLCPDLSCKTVYKADHTHTVHCNTGGQAP
jgi:hypothetical protein